MKPGSSSFPGTGEPITPTDHKACTWKAIAQLLVALIVVVGALAVAAIDGVRLHLA
jgi:hypothetical protein